MAETKVGKWTPPFLRLLSCEISEGNFVLWFAAADNRKYRIELTQAAIGQAIDAMQGTSDRMTGGAVRHLTVLAHQPAATPDRKGILVRTQEWGTIALDMPPEALDKLRQGLAALAALASSPSKH